MEKIYKYKVEILERVEVEMVRDSQVLHFGEQDGGLRVWAMGDPSDGNERRLFHIRGTGHNCDWRITDCSIHLATVQMSSGLVWHIFEEQ